jgi:hypothetical protein
MNKRREAGPLLFSIVIHVAIAFAILNAAFHYDFSGLSGTRTVVLTPERLTYVDVAPKGGATGGLDSVGLAPKATRPSRGLVAPLRVPDAITPQAPMTAGTPGGVEGGRGRVGEVGATTGIVPGTPDPRLSNDSHEFFPAPKTHAERVDSAVRASIYAYNDSVAKARALAGKAPGDWTYEKNGQKWGIDGNKIYLGKFAIPSAVLAALPLRIQGNPGETIADRLVTTRRADLLLHADAAFHDDEFKTAVKRIRERKEKEHEEQKRKNADADKPSPPIPDIVP